jgi:hypothetical protein
LGLKKVSGDNPAVPLLLFLGPLEKTHFQYPISRLLLALGHTLEAPSCCKNWLNSEKVNFFIKLKFGVKKVLKFSTGKIPKTFFSDSI